MMSAMDKASIFQSKLVHMKANGKMESNKDMVNGRMLIKMFMKGHLKMVKGMDRENKCT
jgi:hypothetical protein